MLLKAKLSTRDRRYLRIHLWKDDKIAKFDIFCKRMGYVPGVHMIPDRIVKHVEKGTLRFKYLMSSYMNTLNRKKKIEDPIKIKNIIDDFHDLNREMLLRGHTVNYGKFIAATIVEQDTFSRTINNLKSSEGYVIAVEIYSPTIHKKRRSVKLSIPFRKQIEQQKNNNKRYQYGNKKTCESTKCSL